MLKPLGDVILVRRSQAPGMSKGGIALPDNAKEKPQRGVVVAIGEGKRADDGMLLTPRVSVGQHVIFARWAGTQHLPEDEDMLFLKEDDVLAIDEDGQG